NRPAKWLIARITGKLRRLDRIALVDDSPAIRFVAGATPLPIAHRGLQPNFIPPMNGAAGDCEHNDESDPASPMDAAMPRSRRGVIQSLGHGNHRLCRPLVESQAILAAAAL